MKVLFGLLKFFLFRLKKYHFKQGEDKLKSLYLRHNIEFKLIWHSTFAKLEEKHLLLREKPLYVNINAWFVLFIEHLRNAFYNHYIIRLSVSYFYN